MDKQQLHSTRKWWMSNCYIPLETFVSHFLFYLYFSYTGRIRKYLEEICVVSQAYVKDSSMTVEEYLKKNDAKLVGFSRIAVGEGIEKKEDDFAAEVAAMAAGK